MQALPGQSAFSNQQKIWALRGLAVAAIAPLLAISAPFVWAAASAGAGMGILAAMPAVGVATLHVVPLAMQKLENQLPCSGSATGRR